MNTPQFHIAEFERLLKRAVSGQDSFYHCSARTVATIKDILHTDYPEREDDMEFLMDMVNYRIRQSGYKGPKPRFPVSRHLDQLCTEPLYINEYQKKERSILKLISLSFLSFLLSYTLASITYNVFYLTIHFIRDSRLDHHSADLNKEQLLIIGNTITFTNECGITWGEVAYRLGFRGNKWSISELDSIK